MDSTTPAQRDDGANAVTFVLTSCGRFDLLEQTLSSFFRCNDAPIARYILVEDSGDETVRRVVEPFPARIELIINRPKLGQMASIDLAYSRIETPYIFHCEDDWKFTRAGFIQQSMRLLEAFDDVVMVALRSPDDAPPEALEQPLETYRGIRFRPMASASRPEWFGMSFNPGLRRLRDYQKVGAYSAIGEEKNLSLHYKALGYRMLMLEDGGVYHLGNDRTVRDPFQPWRPITRPEKWLNSIRKRLRRLGIGQRG
jgi:hypothetical protein